MGNPQTVRRLVELNRHKAPYIIFMQDADDFVLKETEELNFDSHFFVTPHRQGAGGLALLWRSDINLQVLSSDHNHIDTLISFKNVTFHSTFVYGAPEIPNRQAVWQLLTNLQSTREDQPWFLTGDFNEILDNTEKSGGRERDLRVGLGI